MELAGLPFGAKLVSHAKRCSHFVQRTTLNFSSVRSTSLWCYLIHPSTPPAQKQQMDQPLVASASAGCRRPCVGSVCLRRRGRRDRRLGVRGQPHFGRGYPPGGVLAPRSCYLGGGGALVDKGERVSWSLRWSVRCVRSSCVVRTDG